MPSYKWLLNPMGLQVGFKVSGLRFKALRFLQIRGYQFGVS